MSKYYLGYIIDLANEQPFKKTFGKLVCNLEGVLPKYERSGRCIYKGIRAGGKSFFEVTIECKNEITAIDFSTLVFAAYSFIQGRAMISRIPDIYRLDEGKAILTSSYPRGSYSDDEWLLSAYETALRIYRKPRVKFALLRYLAATHIADIEPVDIYHYAGYNREIELNTYDKVRVGLAIQTYYSVIEELGLKCSTEEERYKPDKHKKELEAVGVDPLMKVTWMIRTSETIVERALNDTGSLVGNKAPWAKFCNRDKEINLFNAINMVRVLRNKFIAHRFLTKNKVSAIKSFTIYDLENAKQTARSCLHVMLGTQDIYDKKHKRGVHTTESI